ncbi:histone-fold-containing protein [Mollisia scopiformis]|uniref:Histone H4 n=1 Tax=Mollisia scopiformis TaxID=149040 RepID=A0A194X9B2_MOLSC|nr:histone-fold-containing protein [Mollisia scopiformis]KUJ16372.1 histone-fold-containing protein [Mollisia scopiformis]
MAPPYYSDSPGMRSLANLGDPRAQALARRPGQGLGGKGLPTSSGAGKERSGPGGRGLGKTSSKTHKPLKRNRKIIKDTIIGITKGDIKRLARRGGVKRISGTIYNGIREAMKDHLATILKDVTAIVDYQNRKTVTVGDVVFALKRLDRPIYGFGDVASRCDR